MDNSLLEMEQEDVPVLDELPTSEEADALLKDDGNSPPSSPTAAVKSAIEAQIAENLDTLSTSKLLNVDSNKNATDNSAPVPVPIPTPVKPTPLPLFPNGLPSSFTSGNGRGLAPKARAPSGSGPNTNTDSNKNKSSYASKAKSPPKPRVMVENILFVYSTDISKHPLTPSQWEKLDGMLLCKIASQSPDDPNLIRIANSGYDVTHRCGFIACRDSASENWCKREIRRIGAVSGDAFRAWSKGEQPEVRLCRFFLPNRFDSLDDSQVIPLLRRYNPPLKNANLLHKHTEKVKNGRAVFVELDGEAYSYAKQKGNKVEFVMMDIDCQLYVPPNKRPAAEPSVPGVSKIAKQSHILPNPTEVSSSSTTAQATLPTQAPSQSQSDPRLVKSGSDQNSFSKKFNAERQKREQAVADPLKASFAKNLSFNLQ